MDLINQQTRQSRIKISCTVESSLNLKGLTNTKPDIVIRIYINFVTCSLVLIFTFDDYILLSYYQN